MISPVLSCARGPPHSSVAQLGRLWPCPSWPTYSTCKSVVQLAVSLLSTRSNAMLFRARMSCCVSGTCCAGSHEIPSFFYCYSLRYFKKYLPNILVKSCYTGYIWQKARVPRESFTMHFIKYHVPDARSFPHRRLGDCWYFRRFRTGAIFIQL